MSDENPTPEVSALEALDALSAPELRTKHAELHARRTELLNGDPLNKAARAELTELNAQLTKIVELVNELEAPLDDVAELPEPAAEKPAVVEPAATEPAPADVAAEAIAQVTAEPQLQAASVAAFRATTENATVTAPRFRVASATGNSSDLGRELTDGDLGRMVLDKANALNGTSGEEIRLASATVADADFIGEFGLLSPTGSAVGNARIITEAMRRHAALQESGATVRTAAVGTPLVVRDVPECFAIDNPLLGLIALVPGVAERRGCEITYQKPHSKADLAAGVRIWTAADQSSVVEGTLNTYKPVVVPTSPATGTLVAVSVPVGYSPERCYDATNPEAVAQDLHVLRALQNDFEVSYLLGRIDAEASRHSHTATAAAGASTGYGAFVELVGVLAAWRGYVRSLGLASRGRGTIVVEAGMIDAIAYDVVAARQDLVSTASAEIRAALEEFGNLVEVSVQAAGQADPFAGFIAGLTAPGAASAALPAVPSAFRVRWFDPTGWFRIAPPAVEFGVRDDLASLRMNRIPYFGESFLGAGTLACAPSISVDLAFGNWGVRSGRTAAATPPLYAAA